MQFDFPIAVLISVHGNDDAEHLAGAVHSITDQDIQAPVRLYLGIDGPLNSEMEDLVNQLEGKTHKTIRFETNRGLAGILNALIDELEDEKYIFRMDADDVSLPHRLSRQTEYMESHPDVDVCGTAIIETDFKQYSKIIRYPVSHENIRSTIARRNPLAHPTACFRRDVFKNHRYPTAHTYNQDLAFWGKLLEAGCRFANIEEPLLVYRSNGQHKRRKRRDVSRSEFQIYLEIIDNLKLGSIYKIYPYARYLFRMTPAGFQKWVYKSFIRSRI